ncbi:MAG: hypothetical protein WCQ99_17105 [Pseudomonadota bacterium]
MNAATSAVFQAAHNELSSRFGAAAVYTPAGGSAISTYVLIEQSRSSVELYLQADSMVQMVIVLKADVAAVKVGQDKISINGKTWWVNKIVLETDFSYQLLIAKDI